MKETKYSFIGGMFASEGQKAKEAGNLQMAFDWDKAAEIIKSRINDHPDLTAEAGLQGDWDYTGGCIFAAGYPTNDDYTYLSSNWAEPTLILSWDGEEQEEIPCFSTKSRFTSDSKWDDESLQILGIPL
jgi:hypothetical protein